ncbi:MAG TPA: hypothetical protein VGR89_03090 [Puia sp.]|nr:hypothetical protein [Puia sp.]
MNASLQQQAIAAQNPRRGAAGGGPPTPVAIGPCNSAQTVNNQRIGQQVAEQYGWNTGQQWDDINNIAMAESGWCNTIQNPGSTAYGIPQFLNTTWATVGGTKTSDARTQIILFYKYIKQRYGTPSNAWAFHLSHGWY